MSSRSYCDLSPLVRAAVGKFQPFFLFCVLGGFHQHLRLRTFFLSPATRFPRRNMNDLSGSQTTSLATGQCNNLLCSPANISPNREIKEIDHCYQNKGEWMLHDQKTIHVSYSEREGMCKCGKTDMAQEPWLELGLGVRLRVCGECSGVSL